MPRFEYIDHEGNAHVITAMSHYDACAATWMREKIATASMTLADRASGTVELSDERSRAA
jgi:hypothetical protein